MNKIVMLASLVPLVFSSIYLVNENGRYGPYYAPKYSRLMGTEELSCQINSSVVVVSNGVNPCKLEELEEVTAIGDVVVLKNIPRIRCFEETVLANFQRAGAIAVIHSMNHAPGTNLNKINFGHRTNEETIPLLDSGRDFYRVLDYITSDTVVEIDGCYINETVEFCSQIFTTYMNMAIGVFYIFVAYYSFHVSRQISGGELSKPRQQILRFTTIVMCNGGVGMIFGYATLYGYFWPTGVFYAGLKYIFVTVNTLLILQIPLLTSLYWNVLESKLSVIWRQKSWTDKLINHGNLRIYAYCTLVFMVQCGILLSIYLQPQAKVQAALFTTTLFHFLIAGLLSMSQGKFTKVMEKMTQYQHETYEELGRTLRRKKSKLWRAKFIWVQLWGKQFDRYRDYDAFKGMDESLLATIKLVFHLAYWLKVYIFSTFVFGVCIGIMVFFDVDDRNLTMDENRIKTCVLRRPIILAHLAKAMMTLSIIEGLKGSKHKKEKIRSQTSRHSDGHDSLRIVTPKAQYPS